MSTIAKDARTMSDVIGDGLGKWQRRMLVFVILYPGWHTLAKDRLTQKTARQLEQKGLVEINEFNQIRILTR